MKSIFDELKLNKAGTVILLLFLGIIFAILVWGIISPDKDFSEDENRKLQEMPEIKPENVASGKFMADFEKYAADSFPDRSKWVAFKNSVDRLLGREDNGSAYWGADGYSFPIENVDMVQLEKNIGYVKDFSARLKAERPQTVFSLMTVPTSSYVLREKVPFGAIVPDQESLLEMIGSEFEGQFVPVAEKLRAHKDEYIFYKTDHHWTTLGSFYGYQAWCNFRMLPEPEPEEYDRDIVSTDFLGTTYSKNMTFSSSIDDIEVFENEESESAEVFIYRTMGDVKNDIPEKMGMYDLSYLNKKDKYSMFLSSNNPFVHIKSKSGTGKSVLLVKDSYGNCFAPFLTMYYDDCYIVDLRFFKDSVMGIINEKNVDDVILLYNVPQFANDRNLVFLKK